MAMSVDAPRDELLDEVVLQLLLTERTDAPKSSASAVSHVRGDSADMFPVTPDAALRDGRDGSQGAPKRATGRLE
jgi:hypothetical protein